MRTCLRIVLICALGCALGSALGCAQAPPPASPRTPAPTPPTASGDDLFAAGKFAEAIAAYEQELQRGDRVAELQALILIARLAQQFPGWSMIDELRALAQKFPRSRWGHVASVMASEIDRGTVLRQAVMEAGADLRASKVKVEQLTQRVAALTTQTADQQAANAALKEERARLQAQVRELEAKHTSLEARLRELEAELLALKQVDMERRP